jgi:hypothetical protein
VPKAKTTAKTEYTLDPRNARRHSDPNKKAVESSLRELGAGRSIVVDRDGVVIGGNAVYEQALKLGIQVREVETSGDELIVVRRVDLATDDPKRKALALADNQIATLAEWEQERLAELLAEVGDIDFGTMGFADFTSGENDPVEEWRGMPAFDQEDKSGFQAITVHFADQEGVDKFSELVGQKLTPRTRAIWYPEAEIERMMDKRYKSES